jgi:hypothetical protein
MSRARSFSSRGERCIRAVPRSFAASTSVPPYARRKVGRGRGRDAQFHRDVSAFSFAVSRRAAQFPHDAPAGSVLPASHTVLRPTSRRASGYSVPELIGFGQRGTRRPAYIRRRPSLISFAMTRFKVFNVLSTSVGGVDGDRGKRRIPMSGTGGQCRSARLITGWRLPGRCGGGVGTMWRIGLYDNSYGGRIGPNRCCGRRNGHSVQTALSGAPRCLPCCESIDADTMRTSLRDRLLNSYAACWPAHDGLRRHRSRTCSGATSC